MPVIRTHKSTFQITTGDLSPSNIWDHLLARFGVKRAWHRVEPGLYQLGSPSPESPVFVTGNYTLSFDALRSSLKGVDAYILVLDTFGINVWCAAGKGTFGTNELNHRVQDVHLSEVVSHRVLILPQLGAPGVAAHVVKKTTGFRVEYGPIRADDLPEYLKTRKAIPDMRLMKFPLRDRIVLIPVELVGTFLPMLGAIAAGYLLGGWLAACAAAASILAGVILFPVLLPYLPTREFSFKGYFLGAVVLLPIIIWKLNSMNVVTWQEILSVLGLLLIFPSITAYISLNFTGSTPFTSKTGVRLEMNKYIPIMAWFFGIGTILTILLRILNLTGVI